MERRLKLGLLAAVVVLAACGPRYVDTDAAHAQLVRAMREFAIGNEFHYAEQGGYTDDFEALAPYVEWADPDSVNLVPMLDEGGEGWALLATHVRLGSGVGCALALGTHPPIETPMGIVYQSDREIVCDEPLEGG